MEMNKELTPCGLFALDAGDKEFHFRDAKGRSPRYTVEQVDRDRHYFPSREDAEEFMSVHGMQPVSNDEMVRLRAEHAAE